MCTYVCPSVRMNLSASCVRVNMPPFVCVHAYEREGVCVSPSVRPSVCLSHIHPHAYVHANTRTHALMDAGLYDQTFGRTNMHAHRQPDR